VTRDICISLCGPLVGYLLPIALHGLETFDKVSPSEIHLVDEDCSAPVRQYLQSLRLKGYNVHSYKSPARFKPEGAPDLGADLEYERDRVWLNIDTQQWMIDHCGTAEWAFLMHFDIEFKAPWLGYLCSMVDDSTAQVGAHNCGLVGYRRTALKQAHVGIDSIASTYLVKNHYGRWKVRHKSDPRCVDTSIEIEGWDTNELLEVNLQHLGWKVKVETDVESNKWRVHNGSGSGRCGEPSVSMIVSRAVSDLKRLGLSPVL
jgi:hypothetical protein